jgi:hypothetical protein
MKFRVPELLIGCLLTVAVLAIGMSLASLVPHEAITTNMTAHAEAADEKVARYTWWLAVLTAVLVIVSGWQGFFLIRADQTARMSAEAAQAQTRNFTKLERPYIYIFNAEGLFHDNEREDPFHFLKYAVANYGKTPCHDRQRFYRHQRRLVARVTPTTAGMARPCCVSNFDAKPDAR